MDSALDNILEERSESVAANDGQDIYLRNRHQNVMMKKNAREQKPIDLKVPETQQNVNYIRQYKDLAVKEKIETFSSITFEMCLLQQKSEPSNMQDLHTLLNMFFDKPKEFLFQHNGVILSTTQHLDHPTADLQSHQISQFIRLNDMKNFFAHRFTKRRAKSFKNNDRQPVDGTEDFDEATFTPEIECTIIKKQIVPEDQFVVTGDLADQASLISGDSDYIMNMILEAEKKNREMIEDRKSQMIKGIGQIMLQRVEEQKKIINNETDPNSSNLVFNEGEHMIEA